MSKKMKWIMPDFPFWYSWTLSLIHLKKDFFVSHLLESLGKIHQSEKKDHCQMSTLVAGTVTQGPLVDEMLGRRPTVYTNLVECGPATSHYIHGIGESNAGHLQSPRLLLSLSFTSNVLA